VQPRRFQLFFITVGILGRTKDTYEILEKTKANPINEGFQGHPTNDNNSFSFFTRTFKAGDFAFFMKSWERNACSPKRRGDHNHNE